MVLLIFHCLLCHVTAQSLYASFCFVVVLVPHLPILATSQIITQPFSPHLHQEMLRQGRVVASFPVYHRSSTPSRTGREILPLAADHRVDVHILDIDSKAATPLAPAPAPITPPQNSSDVPMLHSTVLTLSEPLGSYFAELQIGTPPTPIAVIIDTGSELTWIQCKPCVECGQQPITEFSIFDPAGSSSYSNVACDTDRRIYCPAGDEAVAVECTESGLCGYEVLYADKSNSTGFLSAETLTFANASSSFHFPTFIFGCGIDNEGVVTNANGSGLMGLDRGPYSLVSQLNVTVFAYCLPYRAYDSVNVSGYLTFGKTISSTSSSNSNMPSLSYTSMLQNRYSPHLYYLGLAGISINGKLLDIPASRFELNTQTGTGGTIIDSGTTLTRLVDEAFSVILTTFDSHIDASFPRMSTSQNSTTELNCYEVPLVKQSGPPAAPPVTLHFAGSAAMELSTEQVFFLLGFNDTYNIYCLSMVAGGPQASGAVNLIGNIQQQNFIVEYDIGNSRVGFAPTQCSPTSESKTNDTSSMNKNSPPSGGSSTRSSPPIKSASSVKLFASSILRKGLWSIIFLNFILTSWL